jgi:hypothetical protein
MSSVDTVIWPDSNSIPTGGINPGDRHGAPEPFAVLRLLGMGGGAQIQFMQSVTVADQARYLRALAEVATRLAEELDPNEGTQA